MGIPGDSMGIPGIPGGFHGSFHMDSRGITEDSGGFQGIPWGFRGIPGGFHCSFHKDSRGIPEDSGGFQGIPPESPKGFHLNGLRVAP